MSGHCEKAMCNIAASKTYQDRDRFVEIFLASNFLVFLMIDV